MNKPSFTGIDSHMGNTRAGGNKKDQVPRLKFHCGYFFHPGIDTFGGSGDRNPASFPEAQVNKTGAIQSHPVNAGVAVWSTKVGFSYGKELSPGFYNASSSKGFFLDGNGGENTWFQKK
jgi:hypothetical protein